MSCYSIISVSLESGKNRANYDDYTELVRPIVRKYGRRYVVRSKGIEHIGKDWRPDRFIVTWFPDRESISRCFSPEEYRRIMSKRENIVDNQAVVITAGEVYGDDRDRRERKMR